MCTIIAMHTHVCYMYIINSIFLTFDPSVFDAGSHSEEDLGQFIVASRAGEGQQTLSILAGILDVLTWTTEQCTVYNWLLG